MSEETGAIGSNGAMSSMDDFVSAQDNSPPQPSVELPAAVAAVSEQAPRPSEAAVRSALVQINAHLASVNRIQGIMSSGCTKSHVQRRTA